jgi:hypothetical protein
MGATLYTPLRRRDASLRSPHATHIRDWNNERDQATFKTRRFTLRAKLILPAVVAALGLAAAASAASLDLIRGTDGPDNLSGTPGPDIIYARGGNDSIRAHDGNDVVYAGRGNDVARGGPGNDVVYGGAGNDVLWVGGGADVQYGGGGNDILHALANDNQPDIIDCGRGYDVAYVIVHDPVRLHGCEQVIRLSPDEAAATAAANDDNG